MSGVEGRAALVTGAGRGIGEAIAHRLATGGASVAVLDLDEASARRVSETIAESGGRAVALSADVSQRAQVDDAVKTTVAQLGRLDILVNNAGVIRDNLLFRMTDDDWTTVMQVHLRGAFLCSQIAQRHMVEQRYGRIICMSSAATLGARGQANYVSAKAGLQGFARSLAVELGPFGITSNAIAPGFVETAMTKSSAERMGITTEQMREQAAASLPVRRGGLPADVAEAVAYFAAEEAGYVTGQVLYVDGGYGLV